jgi:MSHA biogenesis protein MshP
MQPRPLRQLGMGMITAMIVLVMLATLAAAVVRLGFTEATTSGQDLMGGRAAQAASTGIEWGLYQAINSAGSWSACSNASKTLDLRADMGMLVTVTCDARLYHEGKSDTNTDWPLTVYTIEAVACNGASACPDNTRVGSVGYVERKRAVQATSR